MAIGIVSAIAVCAGALFWPAASSSQRAQRTCRDPNVFVDKSDGVLELRCGSVVREHFLVTFGANPAGPKVEEGDERTPEGEYTISSRRVTSRFHRFMGVSYPNAADRARSARAGITRLGGAIGIHGVDSPRAPLARAWIRGAHALGLQNAWGPTDGCIALMNEDVEAVYEAVRIGTPVHIQP